MGRENPARFLRRFPWGGPWRRAAPADRQTGGKRQKKHRGPLTGGPAAAGPAAHDGGPPPASRHRAQGGGENGPPGGRPAAPGEFYAPGIVSWELDIYAPL